MFKGKKILALVLARGGSKGLPGKNIRPLKGKPLIAWSTEAAQKSDYIDAIVMSTDCPKIKEQAITYGAEVPFQRPAELSTDTASGFDASMHAIDWLENRERHFDLVIHLQPTSPLRSTEDINHSIELYFKKKALAVVSVCPCAHHPWWANTLPEDGRMHHFLRQEVFENNRQGLPQYYQLNGAIYLADINFLRKNGNFYGPKTFAYVMPPERSIDIDTLLDFKLAECVLESN